MPLAGGILGSEISEQKQGLLASVPAFPPVNKGDTRDKPDPARPGCPQPPPPL